MQVKKRYWNIIVNVFQWGIAITLWGRGSWNCERTVTGLKQTLVTCNLHYKFKIDVR